MKPVVVVDEEGLRWQRSTLAECEQLVPVRYAPEDVAIGDVFVDDAHPNLFGRKAIDYAKEIELGAWHIRLERSAGIAYTRPMLWLVPVVPVDYPPIDQILADVFGDDELAAAQELHSAATSLSVETQRQLVVHLLGSLKEQIGDSTIPEIAHDLVTDAIAEGF